MSGSDEQINNKGYIKILGVTICYPSISNVFSMILLIALLTALTMAILIFASKYRTELITGFKTISTAISFTNAKEVQKLSDEINDIIDNDDNKRLQISFWTPDENTWSSLEFGAESEPKLELNTEDWQKDVSDQKIKEFIDRLSSTDNDEKSIFSGFRYYKVCGKGTDTKKCGLWWVGTANKGVQIKDFLKKYHSFWQSSPGIYLELAIINSKKFN